MAEPPPPPRADDALFSELEEALAAASAGADPQSATIKGLRPRSAVFPEETEGGGREISDASATGKRPVCPEPVPPPRPPRRFEPREPARHPIITGLRWLPAWTGLALFVGCLLALLQGGGPLLPGWPWSFPAWEKAGGAIVVIDPGHGGWDTGAVAQGVREKDLNLDVGQRVARVLKAHGADVRLTREDDHFITLERRSQIANALPGAVFVSIHFNDAPGGSVASGIETYYSDTREATRAPGWVWASVLGGKAPAVPDETGVRRAARESQSLADSIQGALISSTAATDRGIKERSLFVTRHTFGPAVLVEGGFVSNAAEARRLGEPAYRQQLADSIAKGILRYLDAARRASPDAATPEGVPRRM